MNRPYLFATIWHAARLCLGGGKTVGCRSNRSGFLREHDLDSKTMFPEISFTQRDARCGGVEAVRAVHLNRLRCFKSSRLNIQAIEANRPYLWRALHNSAIAG